MTPRPDLHDTATLFIATVCYELPHGKSETQWVNQIASRYALFRSQCLAKQPGVAELPARIQAQARVLLNMLGLGDLHPLRRCYVLKRIETDLAYVVDAPDAVIVVLLSAAEARIDAELDKAAHGIAVLATRPTLSRVTLPVRGAITDRELSRLF